MGYFGIPFRNGVPIGLGSIAGFGAPQEFSPSELFLGGTAGAWYDPSDLSTLFTTSAGTTQCAMPGQGSAVPVGLMLDKSQGLVLGPELVSGNWANGAFLPFDTFTASGTGFTGNKTAFGFSQAVLPAGASITSGALYRVELRITFADDDEINVSFQTNSGGGGLASSSAFTFGNISSATTIVGYVRGTSTGTAYFQLSQQGTNRTLTVASVSVRAVSGNHAIAFNNTTARPELRARVNLLERSEEFDNAYWNRTTSSVINAAGAAPDGTNTANKVYPSTTGTYRGFNKTITTTAIPYVATIFAKVAEKNIVGIVDFNGGAGAAWFNLSTGVASNVAPGYVAAITSAGNGWYQCSITGTAPAGTGYYQIFIADAAGGTTGTANGTDGVLLWGADLRPANIGANVPAYQRIADANTYDTSGFPLYLRFDGIDDGMTAASYPVSANPTLCSGNRYLGGGGNAILAYTANPSLGLYTWGTTQAARGFNTWVGDTWGVANSYVASTLVETAYFFNGNPNSSGVSYFLNGTQQSLSQVRGTSDSRTMVNGFQIGYAGLTNAQLFFGNFYSIVSVNKILSSSERIALEQWVAGKTGIVIP